MPVNQADRPRPTKRIAPHVIAATRTVVTARPVSKPQTAATIVTERRYMRDLGVCRNQPSGQYVDFLLARTSTAANIRRPAAPRPTRQWTGRPATPSTLPRRYASANTAVAPAMNATPSTSDVRIRRALLCDGLCTKGPKVPRTETPQGLNSCEKPATAANTMAIGGVMVSAASMITLLPT